MSAVFKPTFSEKSFYHPPSEGQMRTVTGLEGYRTGRERDQLTPPPLLDLLGPLDGSRRPLLLLLLGATPVEVLHHHTDEHVEHEEADQEQERDEVE